MTIRRPLALLLCALMAAPGCATTGAARVAPAGTPVQREADRAVLAEYVQQLPPGSAVRLDLADGRVLRGTLMKATTDTVVVQARTRIPEPAREIALADVLRLTPELPGNSSVGKAIGIGLAAGGAAALAVFAIIIALLDD
jgi:hypothetical protein